MARRFISTPCGIRVDRTSAGTIWSLLPAMAAVLVLLCGATGSAALHAQSVESPRVDLPDQSQSVQQDTAPVPNAGTTQRGLEQLTVPAATSLYQVPPNNGTIPAGGTGIQMQGLSGSSSPAPESLLISIGDVLEISVFDTPELSSRLRVNGHGDVLLPLAGYVHVQGLIATAAAQAIAQKLIEQKILLRPLVTVTVAEFSTQGVTMAGEIRAPGVYQLHGTRTLLDMVTQAGGLGPTASQVISIIHRSDPGKVITVRMNVAVQTPESFAAESYPIQPGDTIFVARSGIVYVVGDMKTPGGFQVEHNDRLTVLDAVALAGGPSPTSKLSDARLIRKGVHGREEVQLDLKRILYGEGPDMLLQDGDILYVPVSNRKIYTSQLIQAAIGAATQYGLFKLSQQ